MKTFRILSTSLTALMLTLLLFHQASAQNSQASPMQPYLAVEDGFESGQQEATRGIFQPRDSRLVNQLDGLTEDQLARIDDLHESHRSQVAELIQKRRDNEITRQEFLAHRKSNFESHQQALKQVLTKTQWEQLRELRAERRNRPVDD